MTNMKNSILRNSLACLGLAAFSLVSPFAADDVGSVTIQGTVPAVNQISVTSQSGYNTLDLSAGATDQTIAVVNEKNNDPDGYTVTLVSANAAAAASAQPRLKGGDTANSTVVNYSIKYGVEGAEQAVTLDADGSKVITSVSAATGASGVDKNLMITFSGVAWQNADTYSDTLTLTIASK